MINIKNNRFTCCPGRSSFICKTSCHSWLLSGLLKSIVCSTNIPMQTFSALLHRSRRRLQINSGHISMVHSQIDFTRIFTCSYHIVIGSCIWWINFFIFLFNWLFQMSQNLTYFQFSLFKTFTCCSWFFNQIFLNQV